MHWYWSADCQTKLETRDGEAINSPSHKILRNDTGQEVICLIFERWKLSSLKPWLAGRLFSAVLDDCGQRRFGRSEAIGDAQRRPFSVTSALIGPEGSFDRKPISGNLFNMLNILPTITSNRLVNLLNFIHPPQWVFHDLNIPWPFKPFIIWKQSENETKPCDKENWLSWTKEAIKISFNGGECGIN